MEQLRNLELEDGVQLGSMSKGAFFYDICSLFNFDDSNIVQFTNALSEMKISSNDLSQVIMSLSNFEDFRIQHFKKRDLARSVINDVYSAVTCKFCGKNKTRAIAVQIRGSDEPATEFVTCFNKECGKHYKQEQ